jgi:hypothetical protein
MVTKSADAPAAGVSPGPEALIELRSTQPPTEAPSLTTAAAVPVPEPSSPSPAAIEFPADPAAAPVPDSLPTVLRGAGIKPR